MPRLKRLSLTGFRNLRDSVLEFPPEGAALIGRNAQGKSNLLEAIYYLETYRSFRGARDDQLVRIGEDHFRIAAELEGVEEPGEGASGAPPASEIAAAYRHSTREKRVAVDGVVRPRLADAVGEVGVVLFAPDDLRLVSGAPAERRRFLDILLSLNRPGYLDSLQRFRQALHRRNATLRSGGSPAEVSAWDGILVGSGADVAAYRADWVAANETLFRAHTGSISEAEPIRMEYEPGIPEVGAHAARIAGNASAYGDGPMDARAGSPPVHGGREEFLEAYRTALARTRERERRVRSTVAGPHRDDLALYFRAPEGERDLRQFGSGGQRRTAALALRLLEAATIRDRSGEEPILLLDDIFAELDEDRSRRILRLLEGFPGSQVLLTAPKESDIRFRDTTLPRWTIRAGEISMGTLPHEDSNG